MEEHEDWFSVIGLPLCLIYLGSKNETTFRQYAALRLGKRKLVQPMQRSGSEVMATPRLFEPQTQLTTPCDV
jgi:hypothetical protein